MDNRVKIGQAMKFGGLDWLVLDVVDNTALLLSKYILDKRAFTELKFFSMQPSDDAGWKTSFIRQHLNGGFLMGFPEKEKEKITQSVLQNSDNPWYGTEGGKNTLDKVFLLSLEEVVRYFGDSGILGLANRPKGETWINDEFNDSRIAHETNGEPFWWWLRSPGNIAGRAAFVNSAGHICLDGYDGDRVPGGVRPAVWVNY